MFTCDICQITLPNEQQYKVHLESKRHRNLVWENRVRQNATPKEKVGNKEQLSSLSILDLPEEISLYIFSFLDLVSLRNVSNTCKKYHCVADDKVLWKTQCEMLIGQSIGDILPDLLAAYRPDQPTDNWSESTWKPLLYYLIVHCFAGLPTLSYKSGPQEAIRKFALVGQKAVFCTISEISLLNITKPNSSISRLIKFNQNTFTSLFHCTKNRIVFQSESDKLQVFNAVSHEQVLTLKTKFWFGEAWVWREYLYLTQTNTLKIFNTKSKNSASQPIKEIPTSLLTVNEMNGVITYLQTESSIGILHQVKVDGTPLREPVQITDDMNALDKILLVNDYFVVFVHGIIDFYAASKETWGEKIYTLNKKGWTICRVTNKSFVAGSYSGELGVFTITDEGCSYKQVTACSRVIDFLECDDHKIITASYLGEYLNVSEVKIFDARSLIALHKFRCESKVRGMSFKENQLIVCLNDGKLAIWTFPC